MISALATLSFALITFFFFIGLIYLFRRDPHHTIFLYAGLNFLASFLYLFGEYLLQIVREPVAIVITTKIVYAGGFGFLFALPMFITALRGINIKPALRRGLLVVTILLEGLCLGTPLIIAHHTQIQLGALRGGMGPLYPYSVGLLISVCLGAVLLALKRKPDTPAVNYHPMMIGLGVCLITGVLYLLNLFFSKPFLPMIPRPFIYGIFILSVSFAATFFSQFSWLSAAFTRSERKIEQLLQKSNQSFLEFVQLIARTLDAKDHYTAGHSLRVMEYATRVARALDLPEHDIQLLKQSCLLHDIGKISIPDGILNKKSPLTDQDREYIIRHPLVGKQILSAMSEFQEIIEIIQAHHERIDGKGYPQGLIGEDIPLLARILAVADTYDAICSERPYRRAKPPDLAIQELRSVRDTQLDEQIVEKFIEVIS